MPPAANIDEAIEFCATDIAAMSYDPAESLFDQMVLWIDGMFLESGIFKPSLNPPASSGADRPGQRAVTDWYAQHLMAKAEIEGPAPGDASVVGTSAVINAVVRVLYAVKQATLAGGSTVAQQTATVALYNATWQ